MAWVSLIYAVLGSPCGCVGSGCAALTQRVPAGTCCHPRLRGPFGPFSRSPFMSRLVMARAPSFGQTGGSIGGRSMAHLLPPACSQLYLTDSHDGRCPQLYAIELACCMGHRHPVRGALTVQVLADYLKLWDILKSEQCCFESTGGGPFRLALQHIYGIIYSASLAYNKVM